MTALCRAYGIRRSTGYKWLARFYERGSFEDLADHSRRPLSNSRRVPRRVEMMIVAMRKRFPHWGPRKLRVLLRKERPWIDWPAPSTIGSVLKRHNLVSQRRRRARLPPRSQPFVAARAPNDVWCVDFKGHFRTGDGVYCYPLTVMDAYSRFLCAASEWIHRSRIKRVRPSRNYFADTDYRRRFVATTVSHSLRSRPRPV
jgi:transposase InsO family protein